MVLVWCTQAVPLPMLLLLTVLFARASMQAPDVLAESERTVMLEHALFTVSAAALAVRLMLLVALRGHYAKRGAAFWCSWAADIPAAWRLTLSTWRTARTWRGRSYTGFVVDT